MTAQDHNLTIFIRRADQQFQILIVKLTGKSCFGFPTFMSRGQGTLVNTIGTGFKTNLNGAKELHPKKDLCIVVIPESNKDLLQLQAHNIAEQRWIDLNNLCQRTDLDHATMSALTDSIVIRELLKVVGLGPFVCPKVAIFRNNGFGQLEILFAVSSDKTKTLPSLAAKLPHCYWASSTVVSTAHGLLRLAKADSVLEGGISSLLKIGEYHYEWLSGDEDIDPLFDGANQLEVDEFLRRNELHPNSGRGSHGYARLIAVLKGTDTFVQSTLFTEGLREHMEESLRGTELIDQSTVDKPFPKKYTTSYSMVNADTLTAAMQHLDQEPSADVMVVNFASNHNPGGGVKSGCPAQEEDLFRRTTLPYTLGTFKNKFYPMNTPASDGQFPHKVRSIYTPKCTILRKGGQENFHFNSLTSMELYSVKVCSAAAFNVGKDKEAFKGPDGHTGKWLLTSQGYQHTRNRIRLMFQMAIAKGADSLVVGAFGCGAYRNSPKDIMELYNVVLKEFDGCLKHVIFAIIGDNYKTFNKGITFPRS